MQSDVRRFAPEQLVEFVVSALTRLDVALADARLTAEVLVQADLRGIDSHGVARLFYYVWRLKSGLINPHPQIQVLKETPCTALLDGDNGLGQVVATAAMRRCLEKAASAGLGVVSVRRSNHFGIAACYAMMALERDMIGLALSNAVRLVVPTFGRTPLFGTNPLSVVFPAHRERPFVLDMATSVVSFGKIEEALRKGEPIPAGWGLDAEGRPTEDPGAVMNQGMLLPLGGLLTELGGHKGYGLGVVVEVLSALLSGADFGLRQAGLTDQGARPANVGHLFAAIAIEQFLPLEDFKANMDLLLSELKGCPHQAGQPRVYIHGEKEYEQAEERRRAGIPLHPQVIAGLNNIAADLGMDPFARS
jgi:LDH2 family malate/lactate/ureidoglycolate dehydrogenase